MGGKRSKSQHCLNLLGPVFPHVGTPDRYLCLTLGGSFSPRSCRHHHAQVAPKLPPTFPSRQHVVPLAWTSLLRPGPRDSDPIARFVLAKGIFPTSDDSRHLLSEKWVCLILWGSPAKLVLSYLASLWPSAKRHGYPQKDIPTYHREQSSQAEGLELCGVDLEFCGGSGAHDLTSEKGTQLLTSRGNNEQLILKRRGKLAATGDPHEPSTTSSLVSAKRFIDCWDVARNPSQNGEEGTHHLFKCFVFWAGAWNRGQSLVARPGSAWTWCLRTRRRGGRGLGNQGIARLHFPLLLSNRPENLQPSAKTSPGSARQQ